MPFWLPWQFEAHEIKITGPFGRTGRIEFNAIENYGWSFPILTSPLSDPEWRYVLEVDDPNAFQWFSFQLSELNYLGSDEYLALRLPYHDYRHHYDVNSKEANE